MTLRLFLNIVLLVLFLASCQSTGSSQLEVEKETKPFVSLEDRVGMYTDSAESLTARQDYSRAVMLYDSIILLQAKNPEAYFLRAQCYVQLNEKRNAVSDARKALTLGHPDAEALHNEINPIKKTKRLISRCCDGTTSYSTGRGTCSHHRGVCGTENEITEYREY